MERLARKLQHVADERRRRVGRSQAGLLNVGELQRRAKDVDSRGQSRGSLGCAFGRDQADGGIKRGRREEVSQALYPREQAGAKEVTLAV